jgi:rhodanese-related sulfurtransferase
MFKQPSGVNNLGSEEFAGGYRSRPDAVLLDVRTSGEYRMGHIPGAVLIDLHKPDFHSRIERLEKDKHYYVYCRSGSRSMYACRMMHQNGFEHTYNLARGINGWHEELVTDDEELRNGTW